MANGEIIAVGSELLTAQRVDTNSLYMTDQLNLIGVEVVGKQVVGDERARLTEAIRSALARSEFVLLSGGLGPTEDDLTRDAAADALGRRTFLSEQQEEILKERFAQIRRPMAEINRRQAYLVEGAEALPNPNGTAPGQFLRTDRGALVLLPGPPRELKPMMANEAVPRLKAILPAQVIKVRSFRIAGMGESDLDTLIAPVYTRYQNPTTTVLSDVGDLQVHLRARCDTEAEADALLHEVGDPIAELLGDRVYTISQDEPLECVVGNLLRERKATISTAESCTGGLLAARLTEERGSSDFFVGGFVTYTEGEKNKTLSVPEDILSQYTAVSKHTALAMAEGARDRSGSTFAVSVTGYAGPGGGTEEHPVGTVFIGLAGPQAHASAIRLYLGGDRKRIRGLAVQTALNYIRKTIQGLPWP